MDGRSILLAMAASALAFGQSTTATLTGKIEDALSAAVPGARITVQNVDTNERRQVVSGEQGEFALPNLAPGRYVATVEKEGFQTLRQEGIELQVDQTARFDWKLAVGSVGESVEVRAEVPLLNTDNPSKGEVIVNEEIMEMPLEDRDFGDLAFQVPGVQRRSQGGSGSRFSVNGTRSDNTNFMVDGFHDQNTRGGGIQVRPPVGAMQEFKMQTTGYGAEHGRLAGGVMNMVLKTGGNRFHGQLFEYLRNDVFDARNFFAAERPKLRRHQYGATLDGPVLVPKLYDGRDKTFFLFSWESYRQVIGQTRRGRVPSDLERAGGFAASRDNAGAVVPLRDPLASGNCTADENGGCFPANRVPASRMSAVALRIVPYYPAANRPDERNNMYVLANDFDKWRTVLGKLDHRIGGKNTISARYLRRRNDTTAPFGGSPLGTFGTLQDQRNWLAGITVTRIFSPLLINEFRAGFSRTANHDVGVHAGRDYNAEFGIPGATSDPKLVGFPRVTIRDLMALGDDDDTPIQFAVNNWQWSDTLTWVKGKHLLKAGGDILRSQVFQTANRNARGTFDFLGRWTNQPFADFLLGLPNSTSRQIGTSPSYLFMTCYGFFAQDDWRARSSLTLNFGLRYELPLPATEKFGRLGNFIPEYGKFVIASDTGVPDLEDRLEFAGLTGRVGVAKDFGLPDSLVYARYRNFAPRFGFAWRPGAGLRTVVRGGYGIFYGASRLDNIRADLAVVFPFTYLQTFNRQANNVNFITLGAPFRTARGTLEGVNNTFGHELRPPAQTLQSWNLTVERQLAREAAVEIAYVGSKGTHLPRRYNLNMPIRRPELRLANGNFPRPYTGFNDITYYAYGSNSIYNAGIVSLRRRLARGFFYRVSYIYSKSIDDASQIAGSGDGGYAGAQDARNLKLERGRSDWDNGHSLLMSFIYETPRRYRKALRNWQVGNTTRMYTGQPFTVKTSNVDLNQGEANRPDRVRQGRLDVRTADRWFDLTAFPAVPAGAYRFGNAGRNILDGPGAVNVNVSLARRFPVRERANMQFRAEAYNVINRTNLNLPNGNANAVNGGIVTGAGQARVLQFALRLQF